MKKKTLRVYYRSAGYAASAALFLLVFFFSPNSPLQRGPRDDIAQYISLGEALLHRVDSPEGTISSRMPAVSLYGAVMFSHSPEWARLFWEMLPLVLVPFLILLTGLLIASLEFALVALALFHWTAYMESDGWLWTYPQSYYSVLLIATAFAIVWRSRSPNVMRGTIVGLVLGAGLLYRSALAFFPPCLVVYELFFFYKGNLRMSWKRLSPLLCVPYLFILPVIFYNWVLHGVAFAFEWGPPDNNIITGAWGLVPTVAGDWTSFVENPPELLQHGDAMRWALVRIAEHPITYLYSCLARVGYVLSLKPLLWILAGMSMWLCRKRKELAGVSLLAGYFVLIHCLMSVRSEYFVPLWSLVSLISAYGVLRGALFLGELLMRRALWTSARTFADSVFSPDLMRARFAEHSFQVCAGMIVLFGCISLIVKSGYAINARMRSPDSKQALTEALRRSPKDPWLNVKLGRRYLQEGRNLEAITAFKKALSLRPQREDWALELAWAHLRAGRDAPILRFKGGSRDERIKAGLGRFLVFSKKGNTDKAQAEIEQAWQRWKDERLVVHRVANAKERAIQEKMQHQDASVFLGEVLQRWGYLLSSDERFKIFKSFDKQLPGSGSLFLNEATFAYASSDKENANNFLREASQRPLTNKDMRRAAELYSAVGDFKEALLLSGRLVKIFPKNVDFLIDRSEIAASAGDQAMSSRMMARAQSATPTSEQWMRMALLHQKWKNYNRAIEIFSRLTTEPEFKTHAYKNRGISEFLGGRPQRAVADLEKALEYNPGMLSAAMTLGAVYASQNKPQLERRVYQRALEATPEKHERSMRYLLEKNLNRMQEENRGGAL